VNVFKVSGISDSKLSGMEVVVSIIGSVLTETGRLLCGSIYPKIKNTLKFQSNLDVLEKEMKPLLALREGVKNETELARKEGKVMRTQVTDWLKDVEELQLKVNQIQAVKLSRRSLNFSKRYRISREVAEKLKEIERLLKDGSSHSGAVAVNHSIPRVVEHVPGPTIQDQTTSSKTLAKTMTLLSDDGVRRIGIWGMGGVGKTTLVRNLNNKLKSISSMQPFGIVIWVTISKNLNMKKVQTQIAKRLNLEAKMEESLERMAIRLYQRLEEEEKFLLILYDVWEKIDLDSLGVPQPEVHKGSKIILTSRFLDVCRDMITDDQIKVDVLNDEEAWQLFSRNAGNVVTSEYIRPFAEAIAKRCCGLPLAIITMGTAMRGKIIVELWSMP